MADITARQVKELRDKTGAGMMDCKTALVESDGDMDAAADWLRTKGLAAAQKKAGRVAADGLIGVAVNGINGAIVEVNAETDFVARNAQFQSFVRTVAELALANDGDLDAILRSGYPDEDKTVEGHLTQLVATIGENMTVRRADTLSVDEGLVVSYVHNAVVEGLGKIGVLVALKSKADDDVLRPLGKQLAMHVAAAAPQALSVAQLDPADVAREREILAEQARASGKPDNIVDKMVDGRLRKYYQEVVLLEQVFVVDGETRVSKVVEDEAKKAGSGIEIAGFLRYALGEGIEKQESDFAAEVAAAVGT